MQILGQKTHIQQAWLTPQLGAPDAPLLLPDSGKQGWVVLL